MVKGTGRVACQKRKEREKRGRRRRGKKVHKTWLNAEFKWLSKYISSRPAGWTNQCPCWPFCLSKDQNKMAHNDEVYECTARSYYYYYPTELFAILEPQNPWSIVSKVHKILRSTYFEALRSRMFGQVWNILRRDVRILISSQIVIVNFKSETFVSSSSRKYWWRHLALHQLL